MKQYKVAATALAVIFGIWFAWEWFFCRFYVGPDQMAVIVAKAGKDLPPGQILAGPGQKGIRADVLGEGRHFLNPFFYDHEYHPVVIIPPGKTGIVLSKVGKDLPPGEFLAEPGEKGVRKQVLGPGKYRLNPYGYEVEVANALLVPIGYAGVVTALAGKDNKGADFAGPDEKGVRQDILQPGLYYINPKQYEVDVLEIGVNQVSLLGKAGGAIITKSELGAANAPVQQLQRTVLEEQRQKRSDYLQQSNALPAPAAQVQAQKARDKSKAPHALEEQKRMQEVLLQPQLAANMANAVMMLPEGVEFPSRDGFQISLDMTVEIELAPTDIAWIFSRYGDLPAVVEKLIMPQITSISRNKGSEYGARDFIMGEGREKFQNDLTKALAGTLAQKKIAVHNALIRHVNVPDQILAPIQQASIAVEQNLTNLEKQNTAKKLALLNTETALITQRREQVAQETEKLKAEIHADQEKQVATTKAETLKQVADIARETARIDADILRTLAKASAESLQMVEGEKAAGLKLKVQAFDDPTAYSLAEFAAKLNEKMRINIMHTGDGTLWTDLGKAGLADVGGALQVKSSQE